MIARIALLALLIAFGGCNVLGGSRAIEIPKEVRIPVPVSCITETVERPAFVTDRELAAVSDSAFVYALAADRLERQGYEALLEAQIVGCR